MNNNTDTNQENQSKPVIRIDAEISTAVTWAIMFLALGLAMIIWPDALYASDLCGPDEMLGCFISHSWGSSAGIAISFTIALISAGSAIWKSWSRDIGKSGT